MITDFNRYKWNKQIPKKEFITEQAKNILMNKSSLTKLLKNRYNDVAVEIELCQWQMLSIQENLLLQVDCRHSMVRDVVLKSNNKPLIFARSCIPSITLCKANKKLLTIEKKPIGEFIFSQKNYSRNNFEYCLIESENFASVVRVNNAVVVARRSVINVNRVPLLLYEVFLEI